MNNFAKKAIVAFALVGGAVGFGGGQAFASSGAEGVAAGSPGVVSGNNIQVPVNIPVNLCGNSINVVGLVNPAFGNTCANDVSTQHERGHEQRGHHERGHEQRGRHQDHGQQNKDPRQHDCDVCHQH